MYRRSPNPRKNPATKRRVKQVKKKRNCSRAGVELRVRTRSTRSPIGQRFLVEFERIQCIETVPKCVEHRTAFILTSVFAVEVADAAPALADGASGTAELGFHEFAATRAGANIPYRLGRDAAEVYPVSPQRSERCGSNGPLAIQ